MSRLASNIQIQRKTSMEPNRKGIMLQPPFRLMTVARSQMGKTSLLIKLMIYYWLHMFDVIYIFCPTFSKDRKWTQLNDAVEKGKVKVYGTVKNNTLLKIWKKCDEMLIKKPESQFMIFFDDCAGQKDFKMNNETGVINQLVSKGNHSHISTVWAVQKFTQCSTIMRSNAEGLLTFFVQSEDEMKYIWKEFGVGNFKDFKQLLHSATKENITICMLTVRDLGLQITIIILNS